MGPGTLGGMILQVYCHSFRIWLHGGWILIVGPGALGGHDSTGILSQVMNLAPWHGWIYSNLWVQSPCVFRTNMDIWDREKGLIIRGFD